MAPRSHLYVSVHSNQQQAAHPLLSSPYHWRILLEPPHPSMLSFPHKHAPPFESSAYEISFIPDKSSDAAGKWSFSTAHPQQHDTSLLGRILIGRPSNDLTPQQIEKVLSRVSLPSLETDPPEPDVAWLDRALHALQRQKFMGEFDIEELTVYAFDFAGQRANYGSRAAPEVVDYLTHHSRKRGKGFWFSYPGSPNGSRAGSRVGSREGSPNGKQDPYGGLM